VPYLHGRTKKKSVKSNPSPRTLDDAATLFEDFTGHRADYVKKYTVNWPKTGLIFGKCVAIIYDTVRDGECETYQHEFKPTAQPHLAVSSNGKQLMLIGGNYRFTNAGIVDN
jgi:hypothetical protein